MKSEYAKLQNKNEMTTDIKPGRGMIRHTVATMVYRGAKTLRDAPADFGVLRVKPESRTPVEIVAHMGDLFDWLFQWQRGKRCGTTHLHKRGIVKSLGSTPPSKNSTRT